MDKTILLVDYENVSNFDLSVILDANIEIKIFVGYSQNKIPLNLVQNTQRLGNTVEWIKIQGSGNDSLDFHIAFFLGILSKENPNNSFIILSKDKGFDPLIKYISNQNIACKRVETLIALLRDAKTRQNSRYNELKIKLIENLSKIDQEKRPKKLKTLRQYIKSVFSQSNLEESEVDKLMELLHINKKIEFNLNNSISYNF